MSEDPIVFHCECGQKVNAKSKNAGKTFPCPKCGQGVRVPKDVTIDNGMGIYYRLACLGLLGFLMILFVTTSGILKPVDRLPVAVRDTRESGSEATLSGHSGHVIFATTQDSYDRLKQLMFARDEIGVAEMVTNNTAGIATSGTKCLVITPGIFNYEVRITSGEHAGTLAFVSADDINP